MGPGVWFRRHSRVPAAVVAVVMVVASLASTPSARAMASRDETRATTPRWAPTAGEAGSGIPALPVVYQTSPADRRRADISPSQIHFSDLTASDGWAKEGIRFVAATNDWMRDFVAKDDGTYPFHPHAIETRKYLARSVVRAFAPNQAPGSSIAFPDLDSSSRWYRYAAVAVEHGWIARKADGSFAPDDPVTMIMLHRALVLALGLKPAAIALNHLHTHSGATFRVPVGFGTTLLGMRLDLRYNAPTGSEAMDVGPRDLMPRTQVAYSLWRATTQPSWSVPDLLDQYANVELPNLGPRMLRIVQWGLRYVGYPYVWGGEWGLSSPEPAALGGQPRSGFDCSGFAWWLLRADDNSGWKVAPPRPYTGWALPQRTSADMAGMTKTRIAFRDLRPGDLMFYDGDGDGTVDHVDTYIGNGYSLDSSSTPGGVTIMWVGDGWYRQHFRFGRQILPTP
ncbi:MAG TPA: NlpC/P60 family protein [Actinomycetota bacterium]